MAVDRTHLVAMTMTDGALLPVVTALAATAIVMATATGVPAVITTMTAPEATVLRRAVVLSTTILLLVVVTMIPTAASTRHRTRILTAVRTTDPRRGTTRRVSPDIHEMVAILRASSSVAIGNSSPFPEPARFLT